MGMWFIAGGEDYQAVAARLNNLLLSKPRITGKEIRELVFKVGEKNPDVPSRV